MSGKLPPLPAWRRGSAATTLGRPSLGRRSRLGASARARPRMPIQSEQPHIAPYAACHPWHERKGRARPR
eukprot:scaffold2495_cov101-Isochrysis_galbana.AAC.4